jgi:acylphosphatase
VAAAACPTPLRRLAAVTLVFQGAAVGNPNRLSRREVLFAGRVQGVGFRYTTRNIAGRFDVTGYVQNLTDGRVRLVAEGAPEEIERFIGAVSAEMAQYIRGVQESNSPAKGEYDRFEVRL